MEQGSQAQRLFLALLLGEELGARVAALVRRALGLREGERAPRHLRLYAGADLHLTLFFLGSVTLEQRAALEDALDASLGAPAAPELVVAGTGAFPDRRRPRVLWLGVRERADDRLARLAGLVGSICTAQGFPAEERPFSAHVTAARVRAAGGRRGRRGLPLPPASVPGAFFDLDLELAWQPREIALVQSLPGPSEGAYRALRTWPLAGPER